MPPDKSRRVVLGAFKQSNVEMDPKKRSCRREGKQKEYHAASSIRRISSVMRDTPDLLPFV
jgi:hypothetical protein